MKILYLCHRLPYPPSRGGKIRPFNMIRHLTEQGHEVTVASLARSREELAEGQGLSAHCHEVLAEVIDTPVATYRMLVRLASLQPSSFGYFYSPALQRKVDHALRNTSFDLIFVHCSSAAQYVERVEGIPKLLDFGDMDSQKWLAYSQCRSWPVSMGYWLEGHKLQRREAIQARRFDLCTCTTQMEWETLEAMNTGVETGWFPNGVDAEFFSPGDVDIDYDNVAFIGRMDYFPNQQAVTWFCNEVMPLLRRAHESIKFTIVGANPSNAIKELARLPGVAVTGSVDDVRPYVRAAALSVAPLFVARGTQNKILESMAMGTPVISSALAARGVDVSPGEHLLTADTPEEYRDAILSVLQGGERRGELSQLGRKRVLDRHDWTRSMHLLDGYIEKCLSHATSFRDASASA